MKPILLLLSFLLPLTSSFNYLVFCPLYAHSHHKFLAKIADTLTDAGHNVTFLAPIVMKKYEKVKYLESTTDIIYVQPDAELEALGVSHDYSQFWTEDTSLLAMIPAIKGFQKMFHRIYENLRDDHMELLNELKARKFDALVFELLCQSSFPLGEYLGVKAMIPTLSMTHHTIWSRWIGEPSAPHTLPSMVSPFSNDMDFKERLMSTFGDLFFMFFVDFEPMYSYNPPHKRIDFQAEAVRAPFVFLNANPYLDFPRPLLTKSILIGGISVNVTDMRLEKLSSEYDELLSKREKNVLISFGSMIFSKDMPLLYKRTIVEVIRSFPNVTFIWKYEEPENVGFAEGIDNVHFSKWVPQTALLADPRLSAFMTHGGLGSVTELSYLGKPAILVPVFADQVRNSKMLGRHNGSVTLSKWDLGDYEKLYGAVKMILEDESYRERAEILGKQLEEQPISPHELLVKHAEFAAKFGELPGLDPSTREMSWISYYMIDIILFFGGILVLIGKIGFELARAVFKLIVRKAEEEKKLKTKTQ